MTIILKKQSVLIIGYGSIGERHYRVLKSLNSNFKIDLVSKHTRENEFEGKVFTSIQRVNDLSVYDYFILCNETVLHYENLDYIVSRVSNKKIIVEKPLYKNFRKLTLHNNIVYVGYQLRFSPLLQYLRKNLESSKVIYVNAYVGQYLPTWRSNQDYTKCYSASKDRGGGVLRDLSHELDYISWIFGKFTNVKVVTEKISDLKIDSDDIFLCIGSLGCGAKVNLTMDYISKLTRRYCLIHENEKTWGVDFIANSIKIYDQDQIVKQIEFELINNEAYTEMHKSILLTDGKDVCTYDEALNTVKFIDEIFVRNK